jgi:polysaccharide biosynthesis/export protein
MVRYFLIAVISVIVFGSCVPSRKLVYLQKDDLKKRKSIPKDTVLRTHPMAIREYRIQPLDILSVTFESLTTEEFDFFSKASAGGNRVSTSSTGMALSGLMVDINGDIEYPVVGKINLAGLTIFEAQDTLKAIASKYLNDVVVRVRMLNFRYTVLGEVNGEQTVVSNNSRLTMTEAIAQAGGLSELADRTHVKILRQVGNETQVYYVNLLEEDFIESPHYFVQQNDVIIVPPLRQRTFKKYFTTNLGLITTTIGGILFFLSISDRF